LKESARAALSCLRMRSERLGLDADFYQKKDLHVHYPGNPLKTDGPSAGLAMACAMLSALTERPLRSDIAMTGEISLRGRVLAIGGVKEKLLAAHARGMKLCFLPIENKANLDDLPQFVLDTMEIQCVSSIDEVLPFVFAEENSTPVEKTTDLP
jgi:ATP-dependent Lon protease